MRKWAVLAAVGFSFLLPAVLAAQENAPPLISSSDPNWQFSDIGGNRIAWSCKGTAPPTIILIAGWGLGASDSFGHIYQSYDGAGRVCMYDRAGIGGSSFADPKIRTLDQLVAELHDLARANNWSDAVLVPHSCGGFIARAYAQKY